MCEAESMTRQVIVQGGQEVGGVEMTTCSRSKCSLGFPSGSVDKETACNVGDLGSILGSGRSPGEGNDNPLQYSCLENPMVREA